MILGLLKIKTILLGISLLLFSSSDISSACLCVRYPVSLSKELKKARAVFVGEVVDVTGNPNKDFIEAVRFKVITSWKGIKTPEVVVYTNYSGCDCRYFLRGRRYLVYAYKEELLMTHCCTYNREYSESMEEIVLKELGEGKAPKGKNIK